MNNPFIIDNILDKQMEPLNLCPGFFSKENGARLSLKHELIHQMAMSKSELFNFLSALKTKLKTSNVKRKNVLMESL
jgi:hypothetical protein